VTSVTAAATPPWQSATNAPSSGPKGQGTMTTLKIIVLGCVLAAVAVTLKIRIETPEGRQPLARAIVTNHLQAVKGELALP